VVGFGVRRVERRLGRVVPRWSVRREAPAGGGFGPPGRVGRGVGWSEERVVCGVEKNAAREKDVLLLPREFGRCRESLLWQVLEGVILLV